jgi:HEAT repeat protein
MPPPTTGTPGDAPNNPHKPGQIGYENWTFWWGGNNDAILHIKESIYNRRASPGTVLGELGGNARGQSTDSTRATEKQVQEKLIPALIWAMDPANGQSPDTESAAYIALAKVTDKDPAHVERLQAGIYGKDGKESDRSQVVRESAALALGLLRRSEAKKQFDAKDLDKVRDFLFQVFEDEKVKAGRTQGFAMLAIGLLGDQPTLRTGKATTSEGGSADNVATTTQRIFDLLRRKYSVADLPVTLLLALGLQDPATVTPEMLDVLKECALKNKLFTFDANELVSSYAALALGRVGTKDYIQPLLNCLSIKGVPANVKRSAAIALGQLGQKVDGAERASLATALVNAVEQSKDESTKNFAIVSLGYLVAADVRAQRTDVLNAKMKPAEFLIETAKSGRVGPRTFAALALGLVGKEIGDRTPIVEFGEMREKAIVVLREGIEDQKMDKRSRAAFAVGVGILQDGGSSHKLVDIVSNKNEDKELRGYAAVALGMIGSPLPDVVKAIREAMKERSSEELRSQTAIALGLLGVRDAVTWLQQELKDADTQNVAGQIVLALAKIGDERSVATCVDILKDATLKQDTTKALACAGLGLIGDLEMIPSLARISKDINYRASTDVVNEVLTIL